MNVTSHTERTKLHGKTQAARIQAVRIQVTEHEAYRTVRRKARGTRRATRYMLSHTARGKLHPTRKATLSEEATRHEARHIIRRKSYSAKRAILHEFQTGRGKMQRTQKVIHQEENHPESSAPNCTYEAKRHTNGKPQFTKYAESRTERRTLHNT